MTGLYLHVPFCSVRCTYCDFFLVPVRGRDPETYVAALCGEIEATAAPLRGRAVDTVHFGGGTPSILAPALLARVQAALRASFAVAPEAEIALEANPEDLDAARLEALAAVGVTRLTVGVQSLDDRLLSMMRRPHGAAQALAALAAARGAGFRSLGADLILGLPGQDPDAALAGIERVAGCGVDHLSLYLLEVHGRTRLGHEIARGRLRPMDDDAAAFLYEAAADRLLSRGFEHYEISNFARPGHRSRHNLKYWTDGEYLGFGPSAHSYIGGRRWSNAPRLDEYIARGGVGLARVEDPQPPAVRAAEALCAGLRLAEGVELAALRVRHGAAVPGTDDPAVAELRGAGLLDVEGDRLRLTRRGRLVSNEVFERLLPPMAPAGAPSREQDGVMRGRASLS
jgi:oxygen-independent coproporphyrinogen-3 oxidase